MFFFLLTFRENCSSVQTVQVEDRPACAADNSTRRGKAKKKESVVCISHNKTCKFKIYIFAKYLECVCYN